MPRSAKVLTPEEAAAREQVKREKALARKEARIAARRAAMAARQQAWKAEQEQKKLQFEQNLSEMERESLKFLKPDDTRADFNGNQVPFWKDNFLGDLARQLDTRGYLSPNQLAVLVKRLQRERETEALVAKWPEVKEGEKVQLLAKVNRVEQVSDAYGTSWKVKLTAKYGRPFSFKTNNEKFLERARRLLESQEPAVVEGKVKWVSDDGRYAALTSRGLQFGGLLE